MSTTDRAHIAQAFKKALQVTRAQLYGTPDDPQAPKSIPESASTPYLGYIGSGYRSGGTLLVAANPGGGGDPQSKTPGDALLEKALLTMRDGGAGGESEQLDAVGHAYLEQIKVISLRRIIYPLLDATKLEIETVAFLNVFPYRTRDNLPPPPELVRRAAREVCKPLVDVLAPERIFFLGSGMGKVAAEILLAKEVHILKRARGDSHVHPETEQLLTELKAKRLRGER